MRTRCPSRRCGPWLVVPPHGFQNAGLLSRTLSGVWLRSLVEWRTISIRDDESALPHDLNDLFEDRRFLEAPDPRCSQEKAQRTGDHEDEIREVLFHWRLPS
jgi:hypothetical protein